MRFCQLRILLHSTPCSTHRIRTTMIGFSPFASRRHLGQVCEWQVFAAVGETNLCEGQKWQVFSAVGEKPRKTFENSPTAVKTCHFHGISYPVSPTAVKTCHPTPAGTAMTIYPDTGDSLPTLPAAGFTRGATWSSAFRRCRMLRRAPRPTPPWPQCLRTSAGSPAGSMRA